MVNHQIPMRKDQKTYGKPSDSYEKKRRPLVNHKVPMEKEQKLNGKPSESHEGMTESQSPLPNMMSQHKKPLKPMCLAIARLRPNESTALAMKESHLFPT